MITRSLIPEGLMPEEASVRCGQAFYKGADLSTSVIEGPPRVNRCDVLEHKTPTFKCQVCSATSAKLFYRTTVIVPRRMRLQKARCTIFGGE